MTEAMPSILTEEELAHLDSALKRLGVTGVMRSSRRAECGCEVETIVREACAKAMDRLSNADPRSGAVWGICRLGAEQLRGINRLSKKPRGSEEGSGLS